MSETPSKKLSRPPLFERAFSNTMRWEGEYVNDPDDPGGETKYGISKKSYPNLDIKDLTLDEVKDIYYRDYWEKANCGTIKNEALAIKFFDMVVSLGVNGATRTLQKAINVNVNNANKYNLWPECPIEDLIVDGVFGPKTTNVIDIIWKYKNDGVMIHMLRKEQIDYYERLVDKNPSLKKFLQGWLRRASV